MPELPEVETFRRHIDDNALKQTVSDVIINRDNVLEVPADALKAALVGQQFEYTERLGKYVGVALSNQDWLVLHFGMTGHPQYYTEADDAPSYERVAFKFENGATLGYNNMRLFGEIYVTGSWDTFMQDEKGYGPDAHGIDAETFAECFAGRRGMIKSALMNQKIIAGIGNIWSDEILLQAGIHPKTSVNQLDDDAIHTIWEITQRALQAGIDTRATYSDLPDGYLLRNRAKDAPCPNGCAGTLDKVTVSGRTAIFCPSCQPERSD